MKRHAHLWEKIIDKNNLRMAMKKACRSNGRNSPCKKAAINRMKENPDRYVDELYELLSSNNYKTSRYYVYPLYEPKLRLIYCLPFYPDRIVHHAIMNIMEPIWDALMLNDSYACRQGKGQHRGGTKAARYVRKFKYCLQCDISQFYVNINHEILKQIIRRKIKDIKLLLLLDEIIDSCCTRNKNLTILYRMLERGSKCKDVPVEIAKLECGKKADNGAKTGLPIGNYVSQWFGNIYLTELDRYIKQNLKVKGYVRYCDDFVIFSDDKAELQSWKKKIKIWMWQHLQMQYSKAEVYPTAQGVDFLGYRYFPQGYVLIRKSTAKRVMRRMKELPLKLHAGRISRATAIAKIASAKGWLKWAKTYNFRKHIRIMELESEVRKYSETI